MQQDDTNAAREAEFVALLQQIPPEQRASVLHDMQAVVQQWAPRFDDQQSAR